MKLVYQLCICLCVVACMSCSENQLLISNDRVESSPTILQLESGSVTTDGKQMIFDNDAVYHEFKAKIQQDSILRKELARDYGFLLLHESSNEAYDKKYLFSNLSFGDLYSLNHEGKMTIKNDIIVFDSLYQYIVPAEKASLLNKIAIKDLAVVINKYHDVLDASNARLTSLNGKDARYQREYQRGDNNQWRKLVHEIFTNKIAHSNGTFTHELILNFKHEYKSGSSWYLSSEPRNVSWNVNYDGHFFKNYHKYEFPVLQSSGSVLNATYQVAPILISFLTPSSAGGDGYWNIEIRGRLESAAYWAGLINESPCPGCNPSVLW